jgi:hypothetical protein
VSQEKTIDVENLWWSKEKTPSSDPNFIGPRDLYIKAKDGRIYRFVNATVLDVQVSGEERVTLCSEPVSEFIDRVLPPELSRADH